MKEIQLTQGKVALVDDEDYEYLNQWKWHAQKNGSTYYVARTIKKNCGGKVNLFMHRVVNKTPCGLFTDHIDMNGLNNQKTNLRNATKSENLKNKESRGESKYKGVHRLVININRFNKKKGTSKVYTYKYWAVEIFDTNGNNRIRLGTFKNEIDAAKKANEGMLKYHGKFARLNIID